MRVVDQTRQLAATILSMVAMEMGNVEQVIE